MPSRVVVVSSKGHIIQVSHVLSDACHPFGHHLRHQRCILRCCHVCKLTSDTSTAGRAPLDLAVCSRLSRQRGPLQFDDLHYARRRYNAFGAYAQSKACNILFASELARR